MLRAVGGHGCCNWRRLMRRLQGHETQKDAHNKLKNTSREQGNARAKLTKGPGQAEEGAVEAEGGPEGAEGGARHTEEGPTDVGGDAYEGPGEAQEEGMIGTCREPLY